MPDEKMLKNSSLSDIGLADAPPGDILTRSELDAAIHDSGGIYKELLYDLVASSANLLDDRVSRNKEGVLEIGASRSAEKNVIRFYEDSKPGAEPGWVLRIGARADSSVGFEIAEGAVPGLFIQKGTGNVGLGSRNPQQRLHVGGALKVTDTIEAKGAMTAAGGLVIPEGQTLRVDGTLAAKGVIAADGGLTIPAGQALTLNGLLALKGALTVAEKLEVSGAITATGGMMLTDTAKTPKTVLDVGGASDQADKVSLQLKSGNSKEDERSTQIAFGYANTANYRHAIKTRHNGEGKKGNAIDFFVWLNGDKIGDIGSKRVASMDPELGVTAVNGVLVGCAAEKLRLVRGSVHENGTVADGEGFEVHQIEGKTGHYRVDCKVAFTGPPSIVAQVVNTKWDTLDNVLVGLIQDGKNQSFEVKTGDDRGKGAWRSFHFIIIGPA